jgi:hypothetical protein
VEFEKITKKIKMNIIIDYDKNESQTLKIEKAKYLSDFAIRIRFNDGTEQVVDFKPFLTKSLHPSIKKYLDEKLFATFQIIDGNLNWNDFEMIFPISDLYKGEIR